MNNFNIENYEKLLFSFLNAGYTFKKFHDISQDRINLQSPFVLMRHDVDFCLDKALVLAEVEAQINISSTFFIKLSSPLYNLFCEPSKQIIDRIHTLGHDIALHFDPQIYGDKWKIQFLNEIEILSERFPYFNKSIISFHRPSKNISEIKTLTLPDNISHTYEKLFFEDLCYYSDSRCEWRYGHPSSSEDFLLKKSFQLLTHPVWWVENGICRDEKIHNFLQSRKNTQINQIEEYVVSFLLNKVDD